MEFCSNSLFTEDEFSRFSSSCHSLRLLSNSCGTLLHHRWMTQSKEDLPKSSDLHELAQNLAEKKRHTLTADEVQSILNEKEKVSQGFFFLWSQTIALHTDFVRFISACGASQPSNGEDRFGIEVEDRKIGRKSRGGGRRNRSSRKFLLVLLIVVRLLHNTPDFNNTSLCRLVSLKV